MTRAREIWRRVRRWLEPPRRLRPTRFGWFFMAGVIALGVAAINTGNNLLYFVLGMFLAAIVVSGILSERNLRYLRIERLAVGRATAGEPVSLTFSVTRLRGRIPALALTLADRDPESGVTGMRVSMPRVDVGRTRRRNYLAVFAKRGVARIVEAEAGTAYPFGLFRKSRTLDVESEVRVRPRPIEADVSAIEGGREDGVSRAMVRGEGLDLFGLRDQNASDDARKIHWKATARARRVLVKDMAREEPPQAVVSLALAGWGTDDAFEEGVSRAAGVALALLEEGYSVGLAAGELTLAPRAGEEQGEAILDALVDVARGHGREALSVPGAALVRIEPRDAAPTVEAKPAFAKGA